MRVLRIAGCNDMMQRHIAEAVTLLARALQGYDAFTLENHAHKNLLARAYNELGELQEAFEHQQKVIAEEFVDHFLEASKGGA